ncbi:MAG TPA: pyridoxamine 5'-phosphate oxidase family protein [Anaerolineae bacterium]
MSKDYAKLPYTHTRRQDRAVTDDAWIRDFLRQAPMGVLATVYDGQPFINTNLFVYDETAGAIYMHTARVGRTQSNGAAAERVCFSVSEMGRLLPADEALEFSVEYKSVVVFGTAQIVTDVTEAERGLQLLLDKYAPHLRPAGTIVPSCRRKSSARPFTVLTLSSGAARRRKWRPIFRVRLIMGIGDWRLRIGDWRLEIALISRAKDELGFGCWFGIRGGDSRNNGRQFVAGPATLS